MKSLIFSVLFSQLIISITAQEAICYLKGTTAHPDIDGIIVFSQSGNKINIVGVATSVTGEHGAHIHQYGDLTDATTALNTGGHFNPFNKNHSCPPSADRQAGDLGNTVSGSSQNVILSATNELVDVKAIVGLGFILHEKKDDCASPTSSGSRLAQCAIGIKKGSETTAYFSGAAVNATCVYADGGISGYLTLDQNQDIVSIHGDISGLPTSANISFEIVDHGEMSATVMTDCKEIVYSSQYTAGNALHVNTSLPTGRTLMGGPSSLLGRQICILNRESSSILAHCVIGKQCCTPSVVPSATTGQEPITGQASHNGEGDRYNSSALIVGIVVAAIVLIGLASYTWIQRRRRANNQWSRVIS